MARPKKRKGLGRDRLLQVRVQDSEYLLFKEAADQSGIALSTWVRERLIQAVRKEKKTYLEPRTPEKNGRAK